MPLWGHYTWSRIWWSSYISCFKQNVSSIPWLQLTKTISVDDTIVRRCLMLLSFSFSWNLLRSGPYVVLPWLVKWSWRRRISFKCRNCCRLLLIAQVIIARHNPRGFLPCWAKCKKCGFHLWVKYGYPDGSPLRFLAFFLNIQVLWGFTFSLLSLVPEVLILSSIYW